MKYSSLLNVLYAFPKRNILKYDSNILFQQDHTVCSFANHSQETNPHSHIWNTSDKSQEWKILAVNTAYDILITNQICKMHWGIREIWRILTDCRTVPWIIHSAPETLPQNYRTLLCFTVYEMLPAVLFKFWIYRLRSVDKFVGLLIDLLIFVVLFSDLLFCSVLALHRYYLIGTI